MTPATYRIEHHSTDEVSEHERVEFWNALLSTYHGRLSCRPRHPGRFSGNIVRQQSGTYQLVTWRAGEEWAHRTAGHVRQGSDDDYRLALVHSGSLVIRQNDDLATLEPGDGVLFTMNTPVEIWHDASVRGVVMTIPQRVVDGRLGRCAAFAHPIDMRIGLGRVVRDLLGGLVAQGEHLSPTQFDAVCDRLAELACMLVVGDDRPTGPAHLTEIAAAARRYVGAHATDPALSPHAVARALGWSLRQLQVALQHDGTTPSVLIRDERLRVVRERLQNPAYRHWTIARLACAVGFSSASALCTAFRKRYGLPPSDVRGGPASAAAGGAA